MNEDKKIFRLDLSIAIEAHDEQEAFDMLTTDETLSQIKGLIINSKGNIKEMLRKEITDEEIIN